MRVVDLAGGQHSDPQESWSPPSAIIVNSSGGLVVLARRMLLLAGW